MATLMQIDDILFQDNVIQKPPHHSREVAASRLRLLAFRPAIGTHYLVALTPVTENSGCLHYWPGSHHFEYQATDFMTGTEQPKITNYPSLMGVRKLSGMPLSRRNLVLHPLAWHMSPGNTTTQARCGWSITFLHPLVRWNPSPAPHHGIIAYLQPEELIEPQSLSTYVASYPIEPCTRSF